MILTHTTELQFTKCYSKVLTLSPCFNNTFAFLAHNEIYHSQIFVHCDSSGKILMEHAFENIVDGFEMISQRQAFLLDPYTDNLILINLEEKSIKKYPYQFMVNRAEQSQIMTFSKTKLLCVREWGEYEDHRMKLSYFIYSKMDKPLFDFQTTQNQWTNQFIVKRGNNHSMVIWFKCRQTDEIQLRIFQADISGLQITPKFEIFTTKNTLGDAYDLSNIQIAINNAWQMKKGKIMLVCISSKNDFHKVSPNGGVVKNNFVFETDQLIVREANFYFQKEYNDYLIDILYLGTVSMFRTYYFDHGVAKESPVYFVNNIFQQILCEQVWECSYKYKFFVPGYNGNMLVQCQYENRDVKEITIRKKQLIDTKMIALHFLLETYQDFDDDLLKGSIDFLPDFSQQYQ